VLSGPGAGVSAVAIQRLTVRPLSVFISAM
jgi:hypothetical protein